MAEARSQELHLDLPVGCHESNIQGSTCCLPGCVWAIIWLGSGGRSQFQALHNDSLTSQTVAWHIVPHQWPQDISLSPWNHMFTFYLYRNFLKCPWHFPASCAPYSAAELHVHYGCLALSGWVFLCWNVTTVLWLPWRCSRDWELPNSSSAETQG